MLKNKKTIMAALLSLVFVTGALMNTAQAADNYDTRELSLPLDVSKGETGDLIARTFIEVFEKHYKQKVIVENINTRARTEILNADGDGFTIGIISVSPVFAKPSETEEFLKLYNVYANIVTSYTLFVIGNNVQVKDWNSFEDVSKTKKFMIATNGKGSPAYLLAKNLILTTPAKFEIIAYGNSSIASDDVAKGKIEGAFISSPLAMNNAVSGVVTPLFTTSPVRHKELPNVPTAKELGLKGMVPVNFALITPKNLTPEGNKLLGDALNKVVADPEFQQKIDKIGVKFEFKNQADTIKQIREQAKFFTEIYAK